MTLNDVLTKLNVLTKLVLANDGKELPKELKVKIMRIRMDYNKVKKQFDQDIDDFRKEIVTEEFSTLANNESRTEAEETRFNELNNKANSEYMEFVMQKGNEEIKNEISDTFTESEYADILDVNASNDVEINGNKVKAADFLEAVYDLFVK